jgi:predicted RNA binding protein YcfA (HicA-like mRNA interferase family)
MKTKVLIKRLTQNGWYLERIKGSHHIYNHPNGARPVTVPVHGKEVTDRFAKIIIKQAEQALGKE